MKECQPVRHVGCFKSAPIKAPLETHMHQSNSMLEVTESYCFPHEYINIDNFFITGSVSKHRGSELDPCTDSEDKVFTVG